MKAVIALLTIGVVASAALVGATAASTHSETGTTDLAHIAASPSEWDGQKVTVEGWVGFTTDRWFALWGDDGLSITVRGVGDMPTGGVANTVSVTGTVGIDTSLDHEQVYIFARSWEYIN